MTRDNIIIILDHNHGYSLIYIYPRENITSKHLKTGNWNLIQCQDSSYKPSFIHLHQWCCYSSSSVFKQNRDNIGSFIFLFSPNLRRLNLSQTCQWQWVEVLTKKRRPSSLFYFNSVETGCTWSPCLHNKSYLACLQHIHQHSLDSSYDAI